MNHPATTPPTLVVDISKGKILDSPKFGKDSILLSGTVGTPGGAAADPVALGMEIRVGGWSGQRVLLIPAGDPAGSSCFGKSET